MRENTAFEINDTTLPMLCQMAEHMPGGFFVYHADGGESFLSVNEAMLRLTGCDSREQFAELTGNSFRGFVHPADVERVECEIADQIQQDAYENDYVEYRICCRDGSEKWIRDYGHLVHTEHFGDVFYVFVDDATERHRREVELQTALEEQEAQLQEITALNQELQEIQTKWIQSQRQGSVQKPRFFKNDGTKKTILVVEDSEINREILLELLREEFRVLTAENGEEGIRLLKEHRDRLSLVLLDVYMPVCNGFEFLEQTQRDPYLSSVPVIVATGSEKHEDEERCLRLGAADFITKPYNLETMLGRIHNIIRLHESISELSIVEFDKLTGLYTMSAFLHHAGQLLFESEEAYDLGVLTVQDFPTINRIYGENKGDEVLQYIAKLAKELLPDSLLARQGSYFFSLHHSRENAYIYADGAEETTIELAGPVPNLRIKQGLYSKVDKEQPVSVLCDRAKLAVSSIAGSKATFAVYEPAMEQKRMEEQRLLTAFEAAIENHEFVIWIQPKVNIASSTVAAGEALVRWIDTEGNFISPGTFIPLFEREGQIQQLDEYVFRTVCVYQQKRREAGLPMIPISVNLSRNSLFRKEIVERYRQIAAEEQTELALVPLEITESAATSETQIKAICEQFVAAGFLLQMDDFGTGYSSLSALATLPFSVIKLDKSLTDQIGSEKGNIVVKNIVETAHELGMKVVAEGVEEKAQAEYLALVECDQIQGYFYASPKQIPQFEELMAIGQPFADKGTIANANANGIIRLSSSDLNRYLRMYRMIFSAVRILKFDCCSYQMVNGDGTLGGLQSPCFGIWNRQERCGNCISMKAMQTKRTEHKFEAMDNEVYSVYSVYMEVDGKPHILELLSTVGTGMLHGYKDNISLLDLMQNANFDIYLDVQLGILNRRFFEERKQAMKDITALAMMDIDNFKGINDQYGHPVGDAALVEVARAVKSVIRETDFLIRMGGDELMIGFTGMKPRRLPKTLEDIRKAVADIRFPENPCLRLTVSIGATTCRGYSEEARDKADKALYTAKLQKNCYAV